jgi:hypothetical protein
VGGTALVEGVVSHDEPLPRIVPLRFNDTPMHLQVLNMLVKLQLQFHTRDRITISPAEGWEGNTLVIDVTEPL